VKTCIPHLKFLRLFVVGDTNSRIVTFIFVRWRVRRCIDLQRWLEARCSRLGNLLFNGQLTGQRSVGDTMFTLNINTSLRLRRIRRSLLDLQWGLPHRNATQIVGCEERTLRAIPLHSTLKPWALVQWYCRSLQKRISRKQVTSRLQ